MDGMCDELHTRSAKCQICRVFISVFGILWPGHESDLQRRNIHIRDNIHILDISVWQCWLVAAGMRIDPGDMAQCIYTPSPDLHILSASVTIQLRGSVFHRVRSAGLVAPPSIIKAYCAQPLSANTRIAPNMQPSSYRLCRLIIRTFCSFKTLLRPQPQCWLYIEMKIATQTGRLKNEHLLFALFRAA